MRTIQGKKVFETMAEIVNPQHTALLIMDMQNDFCSPEGKAYKHHGEGGDMVTGIIPAIARILDAARKAGVFPVFVENTHMAGALDESPAYFYFLGKQGFGDMITQGVNNLDGSWGQQTIDELKPLPGEAVVQKWGFNGFHNTVLDKLLRANGIKTVVITGEESNRCIITTARVAATYDYYVVVPRDCVASAEVALQDASLLLMAEQLATSDEVIAEW